MHVVPPVDLQNNPEKLFRMLNDPAYIKRHAFYPLMYYELSNRRMKYDKTAGKKRHIEWKKGIAQSTVKKRPIHYAAHMDALVFSCYAEKVLTAYEEVLQQDDILNNSILAYRKIPIQGIDKNKGTIHFAKEIFQLIEDKAHEWGEVAVLAFDIKSFFPTLNHKQLHTKWKQILNTNYLPPDHQNVYKGVTQFSYVLRDDFRVRQKQKGKKSGFDEKELARIRNEKGISAFFESPKAFRTAIKEGTLKLYSEPFGKGKGIPQGLPISSVLANMYMLDFDQDICNTLVRKKDCIYRRYSDDMLVVCKTKDIAEIEQYMKMAIKQIELEISLDKTEAFKFIKETSSQGITKILSYKRKDNNFKAGPPLNYLGFEYNGSYPRLKSANLAKFYRKMIDAVKKKNRRTQKAILKNPEHPTQIFKGQLYWLYVDTHVTKYKTRKRWKRILGPNIYGRYTLQTGELKMPMRNNYLSYVKRAAEIMGEPRILNQIKKHKKILHEAISRYWGRKNVT